MCGKTKDKIKNKCFREHLGVASISDKIKKTHLRWFGHIQCRPLTMPVRKSSYMQVDGPPRGRRRPKKTWMEVVKIYLKKSNLSKDLAQETKFMSLTPT